MISGGFCEAHLEVDAFDEMLRLLKVGGLIINVMREENRHKCVIYKGEFIINVMTEENRHKCVIYKGEFAINES